MDPVIHLRSAVCLLDRFPLLAGVDLEVAAGEVVLVKGANGAGKTSLLRACAGLLPVVSGEARVLGHDLRQDRRTVRAHIGLLSPGGFLYDDLTARENVLFAARAVARHVDVAGRIDDALVRMGVDGRLAAVPAARLSTGQRRRVALAALVARRPSLWLLDEPHAGLDADGRSLVDDLVREASASGVTVVLASHEEAGLRLAGRTLTMAGGRVVPASMTNEPARKPLHVA